MTFEQNSATAEIESETQAASGNIVLTVTVQAYIRVLEAFSSGCASVISAKGATRSEAELLSFPDHLWDDTGTARNSMQRWFEPDPRR
ncbi:hypothetical protein [Roseibium sp. M-1]